MKNRVRQKKMEKCFVMNPSVAYATVYPMCMFLRVIIAQVLLMFLLN